jgi:hypothetical protein
LGTLFLECDVVGDVVAKKYLKEKKSKRKIEN